MNALLWLLALAGVASFLPSLYQTGKGQNVLLTPLLLCLGYALSPLGLGFVDAAAVRGMQPAVQLLVTWVALYAGIHMPHPRLWLYHRAFWLQRLGKSCLMAAWVCLGVSALLVVTQLLLVRYPVTVLLQDNTTTMTLAWGLLLTGSQMQLRVWQQGLLASAALILVSDLTLYQLQLLCIVSLGCALAATLLQRFHARQPLCNKDTQQRLVISFVVFTGVASLCAGLSHQLDLPHVCTGFAVGFWLNLTSKQPFEQRRWVSQTAMPAQLVVVVLVGMTLQIPWTWLLWGLGLAMVLALMHFAKAASGSMLHKTSRRIFSYGYAARSTAFAAALLFAGGRAHAPAQLLLAITAIAASVADLMVWLLTKYWSQNKYVA
ncbi:MAG: hypothetical protein AAF310_03745 [Myxococcota bacterium]